MTGAAWSALWSHWLRHPVQLATLLIGLALATGLWSAVQAINAEARASYGQAAETLGAGQSVLTAPTPIPVDRYLALRRAGWQLVPVIDGMYQGHALRGVDLLALPPGDGAFGDLSPVDLLIPPGLLLTGAGVTVTGVPNRASDQVPDGQILTDIATAARVLNRPDTIDRIIVLTDQPMGLTPLDQLAPDLTLRDAGADTARLTDSFHLNLTAFGLLSFAVGLFIVHGAVGLAFEQRRSLFRTLRALGLPLRRLIALVSVELLSLALVAGALGLGLGYVVAAALLPDVAATLRGLYGADAQGSLTLRPSWIAAGLGMSVLGTAVASAQAMWGLARMPLLANGGVQAWAARAQSGLWRMIAAGAALILAGTLALWAIPGLLGGFAFLAGLMLGAALLLPPALSGLIAIGARTARGVISDWFWADLRAGLPGLSLALMALLLALATNIGVGTMVSSFRLTFDGWLDQRLASELYITARTDAEGAMIEDWLRPRTRAVLPIRRIETRAHDMPVFVYGIRDDATYRDHWPLLHQSAAPWDAVASGQGALINEQMARRANLWPGDRVTLRPGWELNIVGVYSDYGNPTGQAIVSLPALLKQAPDMENRRFGVRVDPAQAADLARDLRAAFDLPSDAIVDQDAVKSQSRAIFEKTFVVTGALNILTLGVAGFAILTSLLTLWSLRLPQLAPVWALGMTRARLARIEVLRAMALAALTALLALPLGLMLAWALLAVINVQAFGWQLPLHLFPLDWLRLLALALVTAALAAMIPARRLYHLPPSELLKVFANAR